MRFGIQPYSMVFLLALACESTMAQSVDYSVVSVPEESGTDFTQISQTTDYVCMPEVQPHLGYFHRRKPNCLSVFPQQHDQYLH